MSQFTGKQYKGAMAARRKDKRAEAEERNARSVAFRNDCGHVHGMVVGCPRREVSA